MIIRQIITNGVRLVNRQQVRTHYAGSWVNSRRRCNPNILKEMPTVNYKGKNELKKTRLIYICGLGATGSLGLPRFYRPENDHRDPEQFKMRDVHQKTFRRLPAISSSDVLTDLACGFGFTILCGKFSNSSHYAVAFGYNNKSQIGYHESRPGYALEIVATPSPIVLPTKSPIIRASCGRAHSILLNESGDAFAIGDNSFGQCGRPIDDHEIYLGSKRVHCLSEDLPNDVIDVECGQDHSMFLTSSGDVYSCGWGADGQTGLGHYDNQTRPAKVKGDLDGVKVAKLSSKADTVLALDHDGNVFGWGNTEYSQFRRLTNIESEQFNVPKHLKMKNIPGKIVDIAAGGTICAILNDAGQVFVWGFGILGKGPNVDQSSYPTLIPESLFNKNLYNPDTKVTKIYASLAHFAAISDHGDLYTWGKNRGSALGFAHGKNQFFPMRVDMNLAIVKKVALGVDHTCALVEKVC